MKANYTLTITRLTNLVVQVSKKGNQMGPLLVELQVYGAKAHEEQKSMKDMEWVISDYTTPKEKGSLIQMYGKFTKNGRPYIVGVGTKN